MDNVLNTAPVIGKDLIETITIGMYEDSRFIFREYIQNSADQIDKAISEDLLKTDEGEIHISIDKKKKRIEIQDNATGISTDVVLPILRNVAMSTKERGKDKGFRGIGRLGGLNYCSKLIFETTFAGEAVKSIIVWDSVLFKQIINDRKSKEVASEVIDKVTNFSQSSENIESHYFKVILEDVTTAELLDVDYVRNYLRMVSPIEYPGGFIFKGEIKNKSQELSAPIDEYKIYMNGDLLSKSYTTSIYSISGNQPLKKVDEIFELRFFHEYANDGELLYWGWYGISTFPQVIEKCNEARGIRIRKSNIQIGSADTLIDLFKEQRGNHYFFGEVHAAHRDLIPNSRRDNFCENEVFAEYSQSLKNFFHTELHKLYYDASKIRSADRAVRALIEHQENLRKKETQGFTNKEDQEKAYRELELKKKKAEDAKRTLDNIQAKNELGTPVSKILERVVTTRDVKISEMEMETKSEKPKFYTDKYSSLPKSERKLLSRVFTIIERVLPKDVAQNLIDKIDEELKK